METVFVKDAMGGHSGDDINKGRANAVQLLGRFLYSIIDLDWQLVSIDGGNKRNAIAREAKAVIAAEEDTLEIINERLDTYRAEVLEEQDVNIYMINIDSLSDDYAMTTAQMEAIMFMIE